MAAVGGSRQPCAPGKDRQGQYALQMDMTRSSVMQMQVNNNNAGGGRARKTVDKSEAEQTNK